MVLALARCILEFYHHLFVEISGLFWYDQWKLNSFMWIRTFCWNRWGDKFCYCWKFINPADPLFRKNYRRLRKQIVVNTLIHIWETQARETATCIVHHVYHVKKQKIYTSSNSCKKSVKNVWLRRTFLLGTRKVPILLSLKFCSFVSISLDRQSQARCSTPITLPTLSARFSQIRSYPFRCYGKKIHSRCRSGWYLADLRFFSGS